VCLHLTVGDYLRARFRESRPDATEAEVRAYLICMVRDLRSLRCRMSGKNLEAFDFLLGQIEAAALRVH